MAYLEAIQQLGWQSPSVHSVRTRQGHLLYFGKGPAPGDSYAADPSFLKIVAIDDYEAVALSSSRLAEEMADLSGARGYARDDSHARTVRVCDGSQASGQTGGADEEREAKAVSCWRRGRFEHGESGPIPWLWPFERVMLAARRHGLRKEAASIRALAEGGWPTQFKLHCHRLASNMECKCEAAVGTLRHKLGSCVLAEDLRQRECPEWLQRSCRRGGWDPLFTRGVPARPKAPKTPGDFAWTDAADGEPVYFATGDVYTDGSSKGLHWAARRGGWAAVALDEAGRWLWTKSGTLGGLNVSSFRAELRALLEVLLIAVPPLRIHSDNKCVVDGVQRGRAWYTRTKAAGADLWRRVFDRLEELQGQGEVAVVKVKAHTSWYDLLNRRISAKEQYGNWLADSAAKSATAASENEAPAGGFNEQLRTALAWVRWAARYSSEWVEDIAPSQCPSPTDLPRSRGSTARCT